MPDRSFLTAEWRNLVMVSWAVDPAILVSRVPAGTELDTWGGAVYVSLVAFQFRNTRVLGLSVPGHRNFEEINLRFYVRRAHPDGIRRGVMFLREIVPRQLIALVARRIYHEPYLSLPTRSRIGPMPGRIRYEWRQPGAWSTVEAVTVGSPQLPAADSIEAFIAEHYWGYNRQPDGATMEYRVAHAPWRVWKTTSLRCHLQDASLFGPEFETVLRRPPEFAFVAEGSPVTVYRGGRLAGSASPISTAIPRHLP